MGDYSNRQFHPRINISSGIREALYVFQRAWVRIHKHVASEGGLTGTCVNSALWDLVYKYIHLQVRQSMQNPWASLRIN